jgi:hypothetical protein
MQLAPPPGSAIHDYLTTMIEYNRERNVIFAGARDGRVGIWRMQERWRDKEIEDMERDFE